jgi:hypothetical protein
MWPILADAGSSFSSKAQATVRAPPEDNGRDDPGFPTVSLSTKEVSVCRARCGRILRPKLIYKEVAQSDDLVDFNDDLVDFDNHFGDVRLGGTCIVNIVG